MLKNEHFKYFMQVYTFVISEPTDPGVCVALINRFECCFQCLKAMLRRMERQRLILNLRV